LVVPFVPLVIVPAVHPKNAPVEAKVTPGVVPHCVAVTVTLFVVEVDVLVIPVPTGQALIAKTRLPARFVVLASVM
jgi:hypothetical protein